MIREFKQFNALDTGMSYDVFSFDNGGLPVEFPALSTLLVANYNNLGESIPSTDIVFKIVSRIGNILPEGAIFTCVTKFTVDPTATINYIGVGDNKQASTNVIGFITEGLITSIVKNYDPVSQGYTYTYYVKVKDVASKLSESNLLAEVIILEKANYILPVDRGDGSTLGRVDYFFDNSLQPRLKASATYADDILEYWDGSLNDSTLAFVPVGETVFRTPKYPIIDFFDLKFTQTLENNAMVWIRRKAGGGTDKLTFQGSTTPYVDGPDQDVEMSEDVYYIRTVDPVLPSSDPDTKNKTAVVGRNDVELPSTTAKFVGYPVKAGVFTVDADVVKITEPLAPYFFLAPVDLEDTEGELWEDDTQAEPVWYVNGGHQIGCVPTATSLVGKACAPFDIKVPVIGKYFYKADAWPSLHLIKYDGTTASNSSTDTPAYTEARNKTFAGRFVPGDGNEFYNMKFFRNDGHVTHGAVTLESRKGLKFTNCTFRSEWDRYNTYVTSTAKYNGANSVSPAINILDSYDLDFIDCKFEKKGTKTIGVLQQTVTSDSNTISINDIVPGNGDETYGLQPTFVASTTGNLRIKTSKSYNGYGQTCWSFNNIDNLDMENCYAETFYHGTDKDNRDTVALTYKKPIGYMIDNDSTSTWLKGCKFYGEGIGFYLSKSNDMVYPLFENCSSIANGDEAYFFNDVSYLKLRNCYGETISKSVFYTQNSKNPIFYNCKAKSDTGIGFEYYLTDYWRTNDCHVLSGSGLVFDQTSIPGKVDFGSFVQTANSTKSYYQDPRTNDERSLIGIKLWDSPYKATFRNLYFQGVKNDIDIDKGPNVELYLENSHFAASQEIYGQYNSPAYFIHKGFSGVWEYRDIGGSITTSAVKMQVNDPVLKTTTVGNVFQQPDFSLSFKSSVSNDLGRPSITLGNSNEETQYLELEQGLNKVTVYLMGRLLDVENPLTNLGIWAEVRYKDRAPGDPHIATYSTRGKYDAYSTLTPDKDNSWVIGSTQYVPDQKAYKIEMFIKAGQKCSAPLTICYEYYTTIGEIYVSPYASVINFANNPELAQQVIDQAVLEDNDLILSYASWELYVADVNAGKVEVYDGQMLLIDGVLNYVDVTNDTDPLTKNWTYVPIVVE